jgi:hypothetical protein
MTKRNEKEPDNKALERLKEFNRQREAVPGEKQNDETEAEANDKKKKVSPKDDTATGKSKKTKK